MFYAFVFAFIIFVAWWCFIKFHEVSFFHLTTLGVGIMILSILFGGYVGFTYDYGLLMRG